MEKKSINKRINYLLQSKYNYKNTKQYPFIWNMNFSVIIYYKNKQKYLLFINLILLLIFFNINSKTHFLFKTTQINVLQLNLKSENLIIKFIGNFINVYFPLIDSFSAEFKFYNTKNKIKFSFFKFPLIFELNTLFSSLEYLYTFLNNYKFQLEFHLLKQKNIFINYNYLNLLKLPICLSK